MYTYRVGRYSDHWLQALHNLASTFLFLSRHPSWKISFPGQKKNVYSRTWHVLTLWLCPTWTTLPKQQVLPPNPANRTNGGNTRASQATTSSFLLVPRSSRDSRLWDDGPFWRRSPRTTGEGTRRQANQG